MTVLTTLPIQRRHMLLALGAGALAGPIAPSITPAYAATSDDQKRKARYQESDSVKAYYRVNRYPK